MFSFEPDVKPDRSERPAMAGLRLRATLRRSLRRLQAGSAQPGGMTVQELLDLHGAAPLAAVLVLLSLCCVVPIAGVGNVFGAALWMISWQWWQARGSLTLSDRVAGLRLGHRASLWLLRLLNAVYTVAGKLSRPRAALLDAHWMRGFWAIWIAVQAFVIFLPLPLGNVLPAFSLVALGLGHLLRDGLMLVVSLVLGMLALIYFVMLSGLVWQLTQQGFESLLALFN